MLIFTIKIKYLLVKIITFYFLTFNILTYKDNTFDNCRDIFKIKINNHLLD